MEHVFGVFSNFFLCELLSKFVCLSARSAVQGKLEAMLSLES